LFSKTFKKMKFKVVKKIGWLVLLFGTNILGIWGQQLKNAPRQTGSSEELYQKLKAERVDNSIFQQRKNPPAALASKLNDPDAPLTEWAALRQGFRIVKDDTQRPVFIQGQLPERPVRQARSGRTQAETQAYATLAMLERILDIEQADQAFEVLASETDELGQTHTRLRQIHRGVAVYGAELLLHTDGSRNFVLNGHYETTPSIEEVRPSLSEAEAHQVAMKALEHKTIVRAMTFSTRKLLQQENKAELFVMNEASTVRSRLAWRLESHPNVLEHWVSFVDAQTGEVFKQLNNTCTFTGPAKARAVDLNGVERNIDTYLFNNTYFLIDVARQTPTGIPMFRAGQSSLPDNPVGGIMTIDAQRSRISDQDLNLAHVTSTNNTWSNRSAVSAHFNAVTSFEYFKNVHKRNSIDGKGGTIISIINVTDEDGSGFDNAFWSDKLMVYGNGKTAFKPLAGGLDVAAHEMSHGVIQNSANLEYENQSGAINESMADVFGVLVDRDDWRLGEDVVRPAAFPTGALRDLADPNQGSRGGNGYQPKTMSQYYTGTEDNGGVHINSGIPNWAFYKFATATNREKAEQVYYRTLTRYLTRTSRFIDLRLAVIQSATDLFGASSPEVAAARRAFDEVGIRDTNSGGNPPTPKPAPLPTNPGEDFLLVFGAGNRAMLSTPLSPLNFRSLVSTVCTHKPSVTDDGKYVVWVDQSDRLIRSMELAKGDPSTQFVSREPIWENVAISKDGKKLAAITVNQDKTIWVYSYEKQQWKSFTLYNPTYTQGVQIGQVRFSDALEWDVSGEYLLYDAYNELSTSGFANGANRSIGYWDIGFIKVWNEAKKDFGSGEISKLISNLENGESIANPTFSKNSPNVLAFDYLDPDGKLFVLGADINSGKLGQISTNTSAAGYPDFSRDDKRMVFRMVEGGRNVLKIIDLAADKISNSGAATSLVNNAEYPVWYSTGLRNLPQKQSQTISVTNVGIRNVGQRFAPSISATSGLSVGFAVLSGPAEVEGNQVIPMAPGVVRMVAYQEGNSQYFAATPVNFTFEVINVLAVDPALGASVEIFPNPVQQQLNVRVASGQQIQGLRILQSTGASLMDVVPATRSSEASVEVEALPKGTYWVEIKTDRGKTTAKMCKE
jgi:bacillolysin